MFKTTLLAALAAITVSALAQTMPEDRRECIDGNGKTYTDKKREVIKQVEYLSGADQYTFWVMMDRMPYNTEVAVVDGLFCAHRQAVLIRDQIIASRFPENTDIAAQTTTLDQSILAEESDNSMRPLRMVMQPSGSYPDIDTNTAFDILASDLNDTQRTQLAKWWDDPTQEQEVDVVVRIINLQASKANDPIYASCYFNNLDWVTSP